MRKLVALVFILIAFLKVDARNFYFSSISGDDTRSSAQAQSPASPWKTLNKLNSFFSSLVPGDSVLLKRNEIFFGSITVNKSGTSPSSIIISAYGSGQKPIITGLTNMSGWVQTSPNIWTSAANGLLGSTVKIVLDDNVLLHVGRYPNLDAANSGYLLFENSTANSITDNQLLNTPNWTGAEVVVRNQPYLMDVRQITNHSGTLITTTGFSSTPAPTAGYFFQNSLLALDQQGEYYYNAATKKLSIYSTTMPTNIQVAASGQFIKSNNFSYITIDNLNLFGASDSSIAVTPGTGFKIQNCTINFSGGNGIIVSNHDNLIIKNDSISNCLANGIRLSGGSNDIIRSNYIINSYAIAGMGQSNLAGNGIYIPISTAAIIDSNQVFNSGWNGIRFNGDDNIVKNNYVNTYCFIKDDGGGIYTAPVSGTTHTGEQILTNVVLNGIGARDGSRFNTALAYGIYLDVNSSNFIIKGNSLAYGTSGIFLHDGHNNVVRDNTIFGFRNGQLFIDEDKGATPIRSLVVKNNILFAQTVNQRTLLATTVTNDISSWGGLIDSNYYLRPLNDNLTIQNSSSTISLPMWKTAYPAYDIHSVRSPLALTNVNQIAYYYNETGVAKNVSLSGTWIDARSASYSGTITLQPYSSLALLSTGNLLNPTITWGNPNAITYPAPLTGVQLNASANAPGTFTYSPASGTVLNAGTNTLNVTFNPTDPSTYATANKSVSIVVNKASATLSYSNLSRQYTGLPLAPTITTSPAGLTVINTLYNGVGQTPTNANTYSINSGLSNSNFTATSISGTFTITKLTPTVTWNNPSDITYGQVLTGTELNATASVAGTFVYTPALSTLLNAGAGQILSVDFIPTNPNYNSVLNTTVFINVNKATAVISISNLNQLVDGTGKSITAVTTPIGLATTTTYNGSLTLPSTAGTSITSTTLNTNSNYQATPVIGSLVLSNPTSSIAITNLLQTYNNGSALPVTVTTNPVAPYTVTYNGDATVPSLVGSYTVIAFKNDLSAADTQTLVIQKATAILLLSNLTYTYDATPKSAVISTVPNGLSGTSISGSPQTNAGSYNLVGSLSNANYQASNVSGTMVISKANPVLTWAQPQSISEGTALSVIQLNATSNIAGQFSYSYPLGTILGTGTTQMIATFTPTDINNYNTQTISVNISVYGSSILQFFIRNGNIFYQETQ